MEYNFKEIEKKWQRFWEVQKIYKTDIDTEKPKFYVLDMFPYPSGAGLHVGHPLGYIASDIYSRYMRLKGYNVLHPMGFDAYGLPAEQYAIETGQHPAVTTEKNIKTYKEQLNKLGFSYDWDREVQTCDPKYYKWTQWAFIKMFGSWYNKKSDKAEPIENLIKIFEKEGNLNIEAACTQTSIFTAAQWLNMNEAEKNLLLMNYRIAYLADTMVNWCPKLGTVLANDEVKEGLSARGGHPVEKKLMKQWMLRITAYAQRLLDPLDNLDWPDALKDMQKYWIGRSQGCLIDFKIHNSELILKAFTTRPDTIFGATFMVVAPEHELIQNIVTDDQKQKVLDYIHKTKNKSERERLADVKNISGVFTGFYVVHPFSGKLVPIWVSDYVLAGYGTGAIMAVPAHDSRDYAFAKHFNIPIIEVVSGGNIAEESYDAKEGTLINSDFINGMQVKEAMNEVIDRVEKNKIGEKQINFRLRDAIFSRQRFWGEPFPVYYKNGVPHVLNVNELPLELPEVDAFLPTESGEPPLARAKNWKTKEGHPYECNTMPGFAGSSAYYLRYMDPKNDSALVSKEANNYWRSVDLYIGGAEHATGHLIYSRFWNKFLFDLGFVCEQEPFKKLINQGMIQGRSNIVYRIKGQNTFVSYNLKNDYETTPLHVDVNIVDNDSLDINAFKNWREEYADANFILENDRYICGYEVEKMSKSFYNVVNPDVLVQKYGADTLRLYEMFLGPLEQSKPWDTNGIEGVFRFIKKLWRLYHDNNNIPNISLEAPVENELKILHKTIKKVREDIERFSFNTVVSTLMICVNELMDAKCNKKAILEPLTILMSPYIPHISEELWSLLGNNYSVTSATIPDFNESFLVESSFSYPVSFNGKTRFKIDLPADATIQQVEKAIMVYSETTKWLDGKIPKKIIIVPNRIINIVL
ncbi:MAG: leucine--tRNA ligase [Bacteroidales bacterium]|nr:leucine--tRNA ligase [Bacteroidales bacterium]